MFIACLLSLGSIQVFNILRLLYVVTFMCISYCTMYYPFSHIVRYGHLEVMKYLIEVQGCSAGCTDNGGRTPLHYACQ